MSEQKQPTGESVKGICVVNSSPTVYDQFQCAVSIQPTPAAAAEGGTPQYVTGNEPMTVLAPNETIAQRVALITLAQSGAFKDFKDLPSILSRTTVKCQRTFR